MKNLLYILPLLLLSFAAIAQELKINEPVKKENTSADNYGHKNQIDLDVEFLAVEFLYKRRISKKVFIGGGGGFGFTLFFSDKGSSVEFLDLKLIMTIQLYKKFYINQELGFSLIFKEDPVDIVYKIGTSFFYKMGKVELGFKPAIMIPVNQDDLPSFKDSFLAIPLISLKIPLKQW